MQSNKLALNLNENFEDARVCVGLQKVSERTNLLSGVLCFFLSGGEMVIKVETGRR